MCGCRGSAPAVTTPGPSVVSGWEVTYPDGTKSDGLFLSQTAARKEARRRNGKVVRASR